MADSKLSIVSPCSGCKNQRADVQNGLPMCPRRYWEAQKKQMDLLGEDTSAYAFLTAPGNTRNDGSLDNPVYWTEGDAILVWVAALEDNTPTFLGGNQQTPDITDSAFDTTNINCKLTPYVTKSEADYFQMGRLQSGDQVIAHDAPNQQVVPTTGVYYNLPGTVERINVLGKSSLAPTYDHECPEGA